MTSEEILNNAPKDGTATHYNYKFYLKLNNGKWQFYSFGKWNDMSTPNNRDVRSLSDIRRIVELEKEVERFQKQTREMNQALLQVNERAEEAERERDELELEVTVLGNLLSDLWPEDNRPMNIVIEECIERLR